MPVNYVCDCVWLIDVLINNDDVMCVIMDVCDVMGLKMGSTWKGFGKADEIRWVCWSSKM